MKRRLPGPWVLTGDFNMDPEVIADTQWVRQVNGTVVAPELPTCHRSTYDYFVVSSGMAPSVIGATRVSNAGYNPHYPARLFIASRTREPLVQQLVRRPVVKACLPHVP